MMILAALAISTSALTLWFDRPAASFLESCPVGNGRLGGMLFGGVDHDRIAINEQTMWSGSPQDADREDAHLALPEIRRLLIEGKNRDAQDLLNRTFLCKGPGSAGAQYGSYQIFGDLLLDFAAPATNATDYRRELDLDSATAKVSYRMGDATFTREMFSSAPHQVLVYHLKSDRPNGLNFTARLFRKEAATVTLDGADQVIHGHLASGTERPGTEFFGRLRAKVEGGHVAATDSGLKIEGATTVTLYLAAATNYRDQNIPELTRQRVERAAQTAYDQLHAAQMADHRKFFRRVSLNLPDGPNSALPTPVRVAKMKAGEEDPALQALYFQYGRYLLIGSSRPDSVLPANLQGIWAEEYHTPWNGDFHLNINVQMNYWLSEPTNLSDCQLPLIRYVESLTGPGSRTAKAYYDAPGWVAHVIANPWGFTSPGEGAEWGSTCTGGGWLCEHLWEHYAFTGDREYLKSAYPTMRGAAEFFLAFLVEEPTHHWLVTAPSNSPENAYRLPNGDTLNTCMGPTMDTQIVRELFTNVIAAASELGVDSELRRRLESARARLAPHQIGKHGQIQEWLEDYDEAEVHHRHVSLLYGLHPSNQIDPVTTPALAAAARRTLERRGDASTGWSMAWKALFWSRLQDGDHANILLKLLIGNGAPNLFCLHPPFQIDGNFGGAAAVAEMLMQSQTGEIVLLPAVPRAWQTGSVRGLKARGNFSVDLDWQAGKVRRYRIQSPKSQRAQIRVNGKVTEAKVNRRSPWVNL